MAAIWPLILQAVIGACLGSFAATFGIRLARGEQAVQGASHCDHCGEGLSFAQTVPLVSFVRARGVCVRCGGTIDAVHPAGELAGAMITLAACGQMSIPLAVASEAGGLALLAGAAAASGRLRAPAALALALIALAVFSSGARWPS